MESPKMHFYRQCKNRTYLCGMANYPVSCKLVSGRVRKLAEIRVYLTPWYRVCTNHTYLCGTANYPVSCKTV